jgi:hypothetical protein
MKSVILECVFVLMAFAVLEETASARNYLNCLTKKVTIVDAPKELLHRALKRILASGLMRRQNCHARRR